MAAQTHIVDIEDTVPSCVTNTTDDTARLDTVNARALRTFWRDLPKLLETRSRQWVAYHGEQCLGFANSRTELWQECLERGLHPGEFLIQSIEPEDPDLVLELPTEPIPKKS